MFYNSSFMDCNPWRMVLPLSFSDLLRYLSRLSFHFILTLTLCFRLSEIICNSMHRLPYSLFLHNFLIFCAWQYLHLFSIVLLQLILQHSKFKYHSLYPSIHSSTPPPQSIHLSTHWQYCLSIFYVPAFILGVQGYIIVLDFIKLNLLVVWNRQ